MAASGRMAGYLPQRYLKNRRGDWQISDISSHANQCLIVAGFSRERRETSIDVVTIENKVILEKSFPHKRDADVDERFAASIGSNELVTGCGRKVQVIRTGFLGGMSSTLTLKRGPVTCLGVNLSESIVYVGRIDSSDLLVLGFDMKLRQTISIPNDKIYGIVDVVSFNDKIIICSTSGPLMSHGNVMTIDASSHQTIDEYRTILGNHFCPKSVILKGNTNSLLILWAFTSSSDYYSESEYHITLHSLNGDKEHCLAIIVLNDSARKIASTSDNELVLLNSDGDITITEITNFYQFDNLIESLSEVLRNEDCIKLCTYFDINEEKAAKLCTSRKPGKSLLDFLEEKRIVHRTDVISLHEALSSLEMTNALHLLEGYLSKTSSPTLSRFEKFLAEFSTFLTSDLCDTLCENFNLSATERSEVLSNSTPGLRLVGSLKAKNIIRSTDVTALLVPAFSNLKQVMAKINEYQRDITEARTPHLEDKGELTPEEKAELFIQYLRIHIRSWYDSICPLPWKKASQWDLCDLFIACGLTLTSTKSNAPLKNVDPKCIVRYDSLFTHPKLKDALRIVVEGDPGSGKTMLASQIAHDWMEEKLERIKFAVLLQLKYVEDMTIPEAITKLILPPESPLTKCDVESLLESKESCLILDGLEEYTGEGEKDSDPQQSEVMKVMNRQQLPDTKVIITTRSEYLQDLPNCPMLKIRQFGKQERETYVEKIFSPDKRNDVIMAIENNPLLLEMCDVPLLFVMAVHNIDKIAEVPEDDIEQVTPFVRNMIKTLCNIGQKEDSLQADVKESKSFDSDEENSIDSDDSENSLFTLEEVAFNGLCTGKQQLSWPMSFVQDKISNVRSRIDCGILIVEEEIRRTKKGTVAKKNKITQQPTTMEVSSADSPSRSNKGREEELRDIDVASTEMRQEMEGDGTSKVVTGVLAESEEKQPPEFIIEKEISKTAVTVLQARFLHKIIQEWFAAKHLASILENYTKDEIERCLALISPIELHYVLRFACGISPSATPVILSYLERYHRSLEDSKRGPIADCICQCFLEHNGNRETLREIVKDFFESDITIREEDSRQLQRAKISLLNFASENEISVPKVNLVDVCQNLFTEENAISLRLNSGLHLSPLIGVDSILIASWDPKFQEKDCEILMKYLNEWPSLQRAEIQLPVPPPVLPEDLIGKIKLSNIKVTWSIGSMTQYLDESGQWSLESQSHDLSPGARQKQNIQGEPSTSQGIDKADASQGKAEGEYNERMEGYHLSRKRRRLSSPETVVPAEALSFNLVKLRVKRTISQDGGTIQIPDSVVMLRFPPDAFWEDNITYPIEMRIIPRSTHDTPANSFTDNSSVMVELLPNNLSLKRPAELTLPHCLQLRKGWKCRVSIYVSHHDEGCRPKWEEVTSNTRHELSENDCKIWLNKFCWVKYEIDGKEVEAKKLIVYTAGHKCKANAERLIIDVGYYPEMIGADELLQTKLDRLFVADRQHFLFRKEPQNPLQITVVQTIPEEWKTAQSSSSPKTISYLNIASSNARSCPFVFRRFADVPNLPICIFSLSQEEESVELSIDMDEHGKHEENVQKSKPDCLVIHTDQYPRSLDPVSPELVTRCQQMSLYQEEGSKVLSRSQSAFFHQNVIGTNVFSITGTSGAADSFLSPTNLHSSSSMDDVISFSERSEIAKYLDPEDSLHNDWRLLADNLGFKMDEISFLKSKGESPTLKIIDLAIKRGTLTSKSQLVDILNKMQRKDVANAISDDRKQTNTT